MIENDDMIIRDKLKNRRDTLVKIYQQHFLTTNL